MWKPDPVTKEFTVFSIHEGVSKDMIQDSCGWNVKYSKDLKITKSPTEIELKTIR